MSAPGRDARFYVWDNFWQSDRLNSFTTEPSSDTLSEFQRHWRDIAKQLPPGAAVLDLGCGNGAACVALARVAQANGLTLSLQGVDEAAIEPTQYVADHSAILGGIAFYPRTQMEALPFEDGVFDAAVSQFGVEYGNIDQVLAEAARVLKPNGLISILLLPAKSEAVLTAKKSVKQARHLLNDSPLFNDVLRVIQEYHDMPPESRELKLRSELDQFSHKVEKTIVQFDASEIEVVSAIVAFLYEVFATRKSKTLQDQLGIIQSVRTNLALYAARCQSTLKAAVDTARLNALKAAMNKSGVEITDARSLFVKEHGVIAMQLTGKRQG